MRCVNLEYADDDEVMMRPASGAGLPTLYTYIQYIRIHIQVMMLPCSHFFHTACIGRWFAHKTTCPVCRHEVSPPVAAGREVRIRVCVNLDHGLC